MVDKFVDLHDVKEVLEVHDLNKDQNEPYYLAIMLTGAYQEVMGNFHNLFGTTNEAIVIDGNGNYHFNRVLQGSQVADILPMRGMRKILQDSFRTSLDRQIKKGRLTSMRADRLVADYESHYTGYTY